MSVDHALFFAFDGPRENTGAKALELFHAAKTFWNRKKEAGDIAFVEHVTLASTRNPNTPAGFTLVTGKREKLQAIRWNDEEFLKLHVAMMTTITTATSAVSSTW
jgi:hypothetical protein